MTSKFDYFFWASPLADKPLFALYDLFDNHLMIQSYSHDHLFTIRKLIRSKTIFEIVELTDVENLVEQNLLDNTVIENWGLSNPPAEMFGDARPRLQRNSNAEMYYADATIKDPVLVQVNAEFDNFKRDLQQQLFFIHYCLEHAPTETVIEELRRAIELGIDYQNTIDRFFDLTHITDKQVLQDMIYFLRASSLFYE
jgi:hypothetical protein